MINKGHAIHSLNPEAEYKIKSDGSVIFLKGTPPISDSDIATEQTRLQAEYDSQEYARNRKAEYDLLNQYELMFDDQQNGTTTWVDSINAIKAKYPKENT